MATKNLVLYHYFEKDPSYRDNFLHFLAFGVHPTLDYVMIMSGDHTLPLSELPNLPNVQYMLTPSKRSDFGGYAHLINSGLDLTHYENCFFINSSVRGPFIPPHTHQTWDQIFLEQMSLDVGIVGTSITVLNAFFRHSINYQQQFGGSPPFSHVQTMAYVLPKVVFEKIIASGFYQDDRDATKTLAIEQYEMHLSQLILQQGKNLRCLLPEYNGIDYRLPHIDLNPTSTIGDPNEVLGYYGRSVHPYESVFIKTNRNLYSDAYLARLTYSMKCAIKQGGANWLINNFVTPSILVADYLRRISSLAHSSGAVIDFSYMSRDLENHEKLKIALKQVEEVKTQLTSALNSTSWKITRPLRLFKNWLSK